MIIPTVYHQAVLKMLDNDCGHKCLDCSLSLAREVLLEFQVQIHSRICNQLTQVSGCTRSLHRFTHTAGSLFAYNLLNLLCIYFTKIPSIDGKEVVLVLIDVFSKVSKAFITNNQKPPTIIKILAEK